MRKKMIAGNWKMFKTAEEALLFVDHLEGSILPEDAVDAVICPAFLAIPAMAADPRVELMGIQLGAQNGYWKTEGAFTGEVSLQMVRKAGCSFVILGHSERRMLMGESDETVREKLQEAIRVGLIPIVCVGETAAQRSAGETTDVIRTQIQRALHDIDYPDPDRLIIAYEPVWAIGSGTPASPADAQQVHQFIRWMLADLQGSAWADGVRILYGGSVKPENISDFLRMEDIDGALVGGASLDPASFLSMIGKAAGGRQ